MDAGQARVRASDAEREAYAERIRKAVGEGRLTMDEGDQRMAGIYATTYRDELGSSVADLPPDPQQQPRTGPPERWHGQGHWPDRRGWHPWSPVGPLAFAAVLVGIWALSGAHFFWPAIPLFFLGLVFVRRLMWWRYWANRR